MNKLLNRALVKSTFLKISLLPLVLVPVLALGAERGNHDGGGHDQGRVTSHNDNHSRDHFRSNDRHSNVRVNIGIGAPIYPRSIFNGWSYGVGYSSFGGQYYLNSGYPYSAYGYSSRPVIIERNTYIEQPSTGRVYTNRETETSLLRDLQGRCFERSYDRNGTELRTELDPSACDF